MSVKTQNIDYTCQYKTMYLLLIYVNLLEKSKRKKLIREVEIIISKIKVV